MDGQKTAIWPGNRRLFGGKMTVFWLGGLEVTNVQQHNRDYLVAKPRYYDNFAINLR